MSAIDRQVWELVVSHARDAYVGSEPRPSQSVPIDRRCPSCGVVRPLCGSVSCIRGGQA